MSRGMQLTWNFIQNPIAASTSRIPLSSHLVIINRLRSRSIYGEISASQPDKFNIHRGVVDGIQGGWVSGGRLGKMEVKFKSPGYPENFHQFVKFSSATGSLAVLITLVLSLPIGAPGKLTRVM